MIYREKILDSDWLRAVQVKCNTSAKSVTSVHMILHCDWLKDLRNFFKTMISCKILCGNFENSFLEWEKWLQERSYSTSSTWTFLCLHNLSISNHAVFLIQFGINLHLWVFQKAESTLVEVACAISGFCKLIPKWTQNCLIPHR